LSDAASTDSDEFSGPAADWHPHLAAYISARGLWPDYRLRQHDFGQVNQTLVTDGIHDWIGRDAPPAKSKPSTFEYVDDCGSVLLGVPMQKTLCCKDKSGNNSSDSDGV
jgi:hypothetical protein